jgi:radical SAM protein (TIGR01212 family)
MAATGGHAAACGAGIRRCNDAMIALRSPMPSRMTPARGAWGYRSYRQHLADRFPGRRIRKCCIQAGFTCPNLDGSRGTGGCAYCDNRAFSPGLGARIDAADLRRQWDEGRAWLRRRHRRVDGFIAYFQSFSNTYGTADHLRDLYGPVLDWPECCGLSIGTRPDCIDDAIADCLADLARRTFLTVELGLQSDRDRVLRAINRGHTVAEFTDAIDRLAGRGIELCIHLMLGLPGEGEDAPERLGDLAASLPVQSVKLHNLHIVRGTAFERGWRSGVIREPGRDAYADAACRFLGRLRPDQAVQRIVADAPRAMLVGDPWCRDKQGFLAGLARRLNDGEVP